jgi:hypothetical protein
MYLYQAVELPEEIYGLLTPVPLFLPLPLLLNKYREKLLFLPDPSLLLR